MTHVEYIEPDFPADAFVGTAEYYAHCRVPYPASMFDDLLARVRPDAQSRLLDLACGPGRVTLPLAPSFGEVWAVDLEPEMIDVGKKEADRGGVANVMWMVGRAEDLEAEPDSFRLITISEAFHRLDQRLIGERALSWLAPGGYLAIMGANGLTKGSEPWQLAVADVVRKWVKPGTTVAPKPSSGPGHNRRVLKDVGFTEVDGHSFVVPYEWTIESIVGNLYSTSRCSRRALGNDADRFEEDVRNALLACSSSGCFKTNTDCGYVLGRKPMG